MKILDRLKDLFKAKVPDGRIGKATMDKAMEMTRNESVTMLTDDTGENKIIFGDKTYVISDDGRSITCGKCGKTSFNANDVRRKFCRMCGYHEAQA